MHQLKLTEYMYFGKYKGRSVMDVIKKRPEYITWCIDNKVADLDPEATKAYNIRTSDDYDKFIDLSSSTYEEPTGLDYIVASDTDAEINPMAVLVADQQEKGIFMNKKVVMVTFDNDLHSEDTDGGRKLYSFFTDIEDIAIGDKCVVDCDRGGQLVVVLQVEGLERIQIEKAVSWVVDRIDVPNHKLRLEKQAKAQEILNRLDEGVKQMERVQIYKTMAQCDPAMGILMKELHELDPSAMPAAMVTALPAPAASASDDDFGTDTDPEVLS